MSSQALFDVNMHAWCYSIVLTLEQHIEIPIFFNYTHVEWSQGDQIIPITLRWRLQSNDNDTDILQNMIKSRG